MQQGFQGPQGKNHWTTVLCCLELCHQQAGDWLPAPLAKLVHPSWALLYCLSSLTLGPQAALCYSQVLLLVTTKCPQPSSPPVDWPPCLGSRGLVRQHMQVAWLSHQLGLSS
jgi:hypothetical protein